MASRQTKATTGPPATVSLADAYRFFLPLMFVAELHMLSHAVITAFLARMSDPEPILAAYSMAFYLQATLGSPVWACQFVAIAFIRDRASMRKLWLFSAQTFAAVGWFWALIALTPFGLAFFQRVFGASAEVAREAQLCLLVSTLMIPFVFFRSLCYALLMIRRLTLLVTLGTVVRLGSLAGILALVTRGAEGALVGFGALVACIATESTYAVLASRRCYLALPAVSEPLPTYREMWRFGWPVMLMQTAESGVAFTVNFVLGRLPRPERAIAAFGVVDGMLRVLLGPLRNLTPAVQTLTRNPADMRVVLRFAIQVTALFSLLMCVFQVAAVRRWALQDIMGLPPDMATYVGPALLLGSLLALCLTAASLTRGLLLASRRPTAIAFSSAARLVAVGCVGAIALAIPGANGAVVGILSLIAAFVAEAVILGARVVSAERRHGGLFRSERVGAA